MKRIVISRVGTGISDPGYSCFVFLDYFLRVHKLGPNGESKFEYRFVSGSVRFLRKKSNGCVLLDRDRPLIGRDVTEQKRKQGRFAGPIGANQSDPIAPIDLERDVIEERPAGERFRKL
jgi:hypothetical protein